MNPDEIELRTFLDNLILSDEENIKSLLNISFDYNRFKLDKYEDIYRRRFFLKGVFRINSFNIFRINNGEKNPIYQNSYPLYQIIKVQSQLLK